MKLYLRVLAIILLMTALALTFARRDNSGWIAFSAAGETGYTSATYLMTGNGEEIRPIAGGHNPRWSPNGKWLLLDVGGGDTDVTRLRMVPPSGELAQNLSPDLQFGSRGNWSPDNRQIVEAHYFGGVYITAIDGSSTRALVDGFLLNPLWSPDGKWIYVAGGEDRLLYRISAETGEALPLFAGQNPFGSRYYDFSPSGAFMVAIRPIAESTELVVMTSDASHQSVIRTTSSPNRMHSPRWSPDGEWIAFLGGGLYRIRPDGSDLQLLADQQGSYNEFSWSPDSQWIAFATGGFGTPLEIYRIQADGSSLHRLVDGYDRASTPQYAPRAGLGWHPLWLMIVAILLTLWSVIGRIRL